MERIIPNPKALLFDQVQEVIRLKHYALHTEQTYFEWIKRFIFFHQKRKPREMEALEVKAFLAVLAVRGRVFFVKPLSDRPPRPSDAALRTGRHSAFRLFSFPTIGVPAEKVSPKSSPKSSPGERWKGNKEAMTSDERAIAKSA